MRGRGAVLIALALAAGCGRRDAGPAEAGVIDAVVADAPIPADAPVDARTLPACANPVAGTTISFRKIGQLAGVATLATSPPADPRVFEVGARGKIYVFENDHQVATPFLDLGSDVGGPVTDTFSGTELGLLGLAFHPRYADNGLFYVYYTTGDPKANTLRDVVARCSVSPINPDLADPTCAEILSIDDPAVNHNGGMMEFGDDGLLYIATGDGGGTNDNPLDKNSLLGKMLRIDVDHQDPGKQYAIPSSNPYAGGGGAPEVLMIGLRNPWRWSFDRATGDMWIADVGGTQMEEIDVLSPAEQRGANLGWNMYEGSLCYKPPCDPTGVTFPKDERAHPGWEAIIGGQVYRGTCYPDLVGWFFYGDFGGKYAKARLTSNGTLEVVDLGGTFPPHPTSFHEDAHHEIYVTDSSGFLYRLEATAP